MKNAFLFLALFITQLAMAQVSGVIKDAEGLPLPGASVAAYNLSDELVSGTTTGIDGAFVLKLPTGDYKLEITFIAYEPDVRRISLTNAQPRLNLRNITLKEGSTSLEEVTVESRASMMELRQDKRIFNVGQDLSNLGKNASDVLNNVPSVSVDIDGNVSLRGSQNVRILVDGKPSALIGNDPAAALRLLQGSMIEKIEVITNPSARYDAEGEAGIINIVLKKDDRKGLNGTFEATVGQPDLYQASAGINYRTGKFNWFANGSVSYRKSPGGGYSEKTFFFDDTTYSFISDREQTRGGLNATLRAGADYALTENQTLTGTFVYQPSDGHNFVKITYEDFDSDGNLTQTVIREDSENEREQTLEGDLHWEKRFKKKDHKWTADFKVQDENDRESSDILQYTVGESDNLIQRVRNQEDEQNILLQTDYVRPFSEKKNFELGSRASIRNIINNYSVSQQDADGSFFGLDDFTNDFRYREHIYAAYGIYNGALGKKVTYQTGLRGEYTDIETELVKQQEKNPRQYFNLFPSLFFTYDLSALHDIQLSYSHRISRPHFRSLLPFFSFSDNRNFYSGNPDLNPEFTDSYEAGYVRYWKTATLYSGIYYRHRTGVTERISTVDTSGFTTTFPVNLAVQDAYGFEFNYQQTFTKWWRANANINLYYSATVGTYEGVDYGAKTFASQGRVVNRFTFWKSDLQLSFGFRGPQNTSQGNTLGIYTTDLAWSKDVLKGNGTLALSVSDIFNGRKRRSYTSGPNFDSYSEFQWRQRQLTLNFTYRLNQKKSRRPQGDRPGGMDDDGDF